MFQIFEKLNNKIFTFLESASNLQSEKVPYFWPSYENFQFLRPRGSRQTLKKISKQKLIFHLTTAF
jgi:hypothetical protein